MRLFLFVLLSCFVLYVDASSNKTKLQKRDYSLVDVFGITKFGFQCKSSAYEKFELYAAALQGCKAWIRVRNPSLCGPVFCQTPLGTRRDASFTQSNFRFNFDRFPGPYMLFPILHDINLYVEGGPKQPGPDRLVMNRFCEIITVVTNDVTPGGTPGVKECTLLVRPPPISRSPSLGRSPSSGGSSRGSSSQSGSSSLSESPALSRNPSLGQSQNTDLNPSLSRVPTFSDGIGSSSRAQKRRRNVLTEEFHIENKKSFM